MVTGKWGMVAAIFHSPFTNRHLQKWQALAKPVAHKSEFTSRALSVPPSR